VLGGTGDAAPLTSPAKASDGTPAEDAAPSRTNDCAPVPHLCGFPDETNTGVPAGVVLKTAPSCDITADGAVLDAMDFACTVNVRANGIQITRSKIHPGSGAALRVVSGSVVISDSELFDATDTVIQYANWTALRCNIHDFQSDAVKLGANSRLEDSFVHMFAPAAGSASEGAQLEAGVTHVIVRHSTLLAADQSGAEAPNAAIFVAPDQGPNSDGPVTLDRNLLSGGNYTVYVVDGNNGQYLIKNVSLQQNRIVRDSYRYGALDVSTTETPFVTSHGNVWDQDGTPIE